MEKTVIIVDDKAIMRQALCRLFKAAGDFSVCGEAASGSEAVALAPSLQPDLIVLDLCMPGMNGLETAEALRKLNLQSRIILYSLNADEIGHTKALAAGVSAVISKAEGVKNLITKARSLLTSSMA